MLDFDRLALVRFTLAGMRKLGSNPFGLPLVSTCNCIRMRNIALINNKNYENIVPKNS